MTTFLPIITTQLGSSLLACDWKRIVFTHYHYIWIHFLSNLVLIVESDYKSWAYVGWDGTIVLNASHLKNRTQVLIECAQYLMSRLNS